MSLQYSPTKVNVVDAFESVVIGPDCWAYAIFNNIDVNGVAGTIDFGDGNIMTLNGGATLTMPYLGRPYGLVTIDASNTHIQMIWTP